MPDPLARVLRTLHQDHSERLQGDDNENKGQELGKTVNEGRHIARWHAVQAYMHGVSLPGQGSMASVEAKLELESANCMSISLPIQAVISYTE
ncbi:MAG: hypothetical protein Q9176_006259 [Flavoplaca citrina]